MSKPVCMVPDAQPRLQSWLDRGDAIGVFSNHDLGHYDVGRRVYLPLTPDEVAVCQVGKTRAPDSHSYGLGWRYLLDLVVPAGSTVTDHITFEEDTP